MSAVVADPILDSVKQYLCEAGVTSLLTREQEQDLARRQAKPQFLSLAPVVCRTVPLGGGAITLRTDANVWLLPQSTRHAFLHVLDALDALEQGPMEVSA